MDRTGKAGEPERSPMVRFEESRGECDGDSRGREDPRVMLCCGMSEGSQLERPAGNTFRGDCLPGLPMDGESLPMGGGEFAR